MSRRSYCRHIPDFRLITHFGQSGKSAVHSMNPWTKGFILLAVVILATVLTDVVLLMALLAFTIVFYSIARLPIGVLIGWWTLPVMFVVTLAIMFVFTEPGVELIGGTLGSTRIAVTDNGVMLMLTLLARGLAVVTFSLAVFMSTRYAQIAYVAHRVLPRTLATIFLLSYRFLFVSVDEITDVLDAVHSRNGAVIKGFTKQSRLFAGIFGLAFVHAFERAERISKAMESRGFTGELPVTDGVPKPTAMGYAAILLAGTMVAVSVYIRYFDSSVLAGW